MKKIIILIFSLAYCSLCMGQKIVFGNAAEINLPENLQKTSKQDAADFVRHKFSNEQFALSSVEHMNPDYSYVVKNVFFTLFYGDASGDITYLDELKKGRDYTSRKNPSYSSNIKTYNGNKVLITYNIFGNNGYYNFYCRNQAFTKAINGELLFDPADKEKAKQLLDDLLNGIKFK